MLERGKIFLIVFCLIILTNCNNKQNGESQNAIYFKKAFSNIGTKEYFNIYSKIKDSLNIWVLNKLLSYEAESIYNYEIDSLVCFNRTVDKFICCIHLFGTKFNSTSDDLNFIYGNKINGGWYFFKGAAIVIPRSMIKGQDIHTPLSYSQLHEIALKEVYGGYLNSRGEINEEWFTEHFENVGVCSKCKTKEDFQKSRLEDVRTLWLQRDTTQPIKQLPPKTEKLQ